jgi:hypothetical protein
MLLHLDFETTIFPVISKTVRDLWKWFHVLYKLNNENYDELFSYKHKHFEEYHLLECDAV